MKTTICLLLALCAAGCSVNSPPPSNSSVVSVTVSSDADYRLVTMKHDGHLWVLAVRGGYSGTAPMHHPDCPCGKR